MSQLARYSVKLFHAFSWLCQKRTVKPMMLFYTKSNFTRTTNH